MNIVWSNINKIYSFLVCRFTGHFEHTMNVVVPAEGPAYTPVYCANCNKSWIQYFR